MASSRTLDTYLNGHLGGATAGATLARRLRDQASDEHREAFARLADDIEADRRSLQKLITRLGLGPHPLKQAVGQLAEKVLRFAGHEKITRSVTLTWLLDCETLALGVDGKLALWLSLHEVAAEYPGLNESELAELAERARDQRDRIESIRRQASLRALGTGTGR